MHYNWHRHYDPSIGRYTQPDPLGFVDGPSQYAYARSNPQMFVDPDGRLIIFGYGTGAAVVRAGPTFNVGTGYNLSDGTIDSFASPGVGFGWDIGAGGGGGVFFGDWCDFQGSAWTVNLSVLGFGLNATVTTGGAFGIGGGYTRGPTGPANIAGASLGYSYTQTGFEGAQCSCKQ